MKNYSLIPGLVDECQAKTVASLTTDAFCPAFSALLKCLVEFDNFNIIAYCGEGAPSVLYREFTDPIVYSPLDNEYVGGAYLLDPFCHEHLKGSVKGIRRLIDVAPDHFKRTSYFKRYYKKTTLLDEVAIFAPISPDVTITACLGKDRSSGTRFSRQGIMTLRSKEATLSALLIANWRGAKADIFSARSKLSVVERLSLALQDGAGIALSPRQAEVALLILRGHSSLSISLHLEISPETVKVFRRQLYSKCNISSQAQLFAMMTPYLSKISQ